ncbi:hypothetical protein P1X15_10160 [Runella sp. MFBS21]|uniref:hypothetical protein n=1 Tax=Runella sp. MFBS21 TaxID=3034018 RepID=UPI0023F9EB32|nr:hypothetical protein [Runella sp. MFBS21]MDF7817962.1 hypothetical protein [Runella sp. MFBS21]
MSTKYRVFLLFILFVCGCKETPEPEYEYIIENISKHTVIAYNNDATSPIDNFEEVSLEPQTRATVKTKSPDGLKPTFRSSDPDLVFDIKRDIDKKTYYVNADYKYYEYTLENLSNFTITVFNNDTISLKDNFNEVTIAPKTKATVKTKSADGLKPKLKSSDPDLVFEVKSDAEKKVYYLSADYKQYEYIVENISNFPITVYNNDVTTPKDNFEEVTIAPKSKATVRTKSAEGLKPKLKSPDPDLVLDVKSDTEKKVYYLNADYKYYEYTLENISNFSVIAYNDDRNSPKDNFEEVNITPKMKVVVKTKSSDGLIPKLKSPTQDLIFDVKTDGSKKHYTINADYQYYEYIIENTSNFPIIVYNNDSSNPKGNFSETTVNPNSKIVIKTRNGNGMVPMMKSGDRITEYEISGKTYILNAYLNTLEYIFSGTSKTVNIYYTTPEGKRDSLLNVNLPSELKFKLFGVETAQITVYKPYVSGNITIEVYFKGKSVHKLTGSDPHLRLTSSYNTKTKKATESRSAPEEWPCGVYNGRTLITGPRGGCYYINSNGNKTYVDRSYCNCD